MGIATLRSPLTTALERVQDEQHRFSQRSAVKDANSSQGCDASRDFKVGVGKDKPFDEDREGIEGCIKAKASVMATIVRVPGL